MSAEAAFGVASGSPRHFGFFTGTASNPVWELDLGTASGSATARLSSMTVASESPFSVLVKTINGGYLRYQIAGEKPTKIYFPKELSIVGNYMAFNMAVNATTSVGTTSNTGLIKFEGAENPIDVTIYVTKDFTTVS